MSLIQKVKSWLGGIALRADGIIVPGTPTDQPHVLATVDDGHGGVEFRPVPLSELGGGDEGDNPFEWNTDAPLNGEYPNGWVVHYDGQYWQNQSGSDTTSGEVPGGSPDWQPRAGFEDELTPWDAGPTYVSYAVALFGGPQHIFVNVSGGSLNGAGTDPDSSPADWLDMGPMPGDAGRNMPTAFFVRYFDPPSMTYVANDFTPIQSYGPAEGFVSLAPQVWTIPGQIDLGAGHLLTPQIVFEFKSASDPEAAAQQVARNATSTSPLTETITDLMGDGDLDTLGDDWYCSLVYFNVENNGAEATGQNIGVFVVRGWQT